MSKLKMVMTPEQARERIAKEMDDCSNLAWCLQGLLNSNVTAVVHDRENCRLYATDFADCTYAIVASNDGHTHHIGIGTLEEGSVNAWDIIITMEKATDDEVAKAALDLAMKYQLPLFIRPNDMEVRKMGPADVAVKDLMSKIRSLFGDNVKIDRVDLDDLTESEDDNENG